MGIILENKVIVHALRIGGLFVIEIVTKQASTFCGIQTSPFLTDGSTGQ